MKNPLVLFVGAAVMAVAALAGVTADHWRDWPSPVQSSAATAPDDLAVAPGVAEEKDPPPKTDIVEQATVPEEVTAAETVPSERVSAVEPGQAAVTPAGEAEPVEDAAGSRVEAPAAEPERLAAVDPQTSDPQAAEPPAPSASATPAREPEAATGPSFDVVRLEEDGSLIAAGNAAPWAEVALLLDGEVIATDVANDRGAWLIMPDEPLPPGSHELMVEASDPSGATAFSQALALAVPKRAGDRAVADVSEPPQPARVQEEAAQTAESPEPAHVEEPAKLEPADTPPVESDERVALAPLPEQDAGVDAPTARETLATDVDVPDADAAIDPEPEMVSEPETEPAPEDLPIPLALETVDYNEDGDIVFSGRADPGRTVRIYVDGRMVGETRAGLGGSWLFAGDEQIAPGRHDLRVDLMDLAGEVYGRIILPFVRADGDEVAALVESRRRAAGEGQPEVAPEPEPEPAAPVAAEQSEAEPEAPVAAVEAAPEPDEQVVADEIVPDSELEPKPEAPVVAQQAAPEPAPEAPVVAEETEPDASAVAEETAPEPEPEGPVPTEETAPEPEPGASAVAEDSAPESDAPTVPQQTAPDPKPEAPVVAEETAPEPEPEAPVVAEETAPEPEPEAPVVAEDTAPEPEPEAPVVAEETAPEPEMEPEAGETRLASRRPAAPASAVEAARAPAAAPEGAEVPRLAPVQAEERARVAARQEQGAPSDEPKAVPARPGHVVIQPGNNLWRISRVIYGRGVEYTVIYQANRDKIRNPDLIYPGQIFATPGVNPPEEIDPERREPLDPEELARQEAAE